MRLQRLDERARTGDRADTFVEALVDGRFGQPFEQADTLAQRSLEIELAAHCTLGNVGDTVLDAGIVGQLVDAFLPDHGRIHVGDEQPGHSNLVPCDQHVALAEMLAQDVGHLERIAARHGQFKDVAAEFQHAGCSDRRAGGFECGACGIEAGFQSLFLCYQPGDEHYAIS